MSDQLTRTDKQSHNLDTASWTSKDTGWMFSHIGTGIGAGLLYLPINAGMGGVWPLLLMALISGPMVLLSHRGLTRFCLSSSNSRNDMSDTVKEYFGGRMGRWLMIICFFSMFPVLLLYTIGITNVSSSFLVNQLHFEEPSRPLLVFLLVSGMLVLFCGSERRLLKLISALVFPLTLVLMCIGLYLIPQWKMDFLRQSISLSQFIQTFLLTLPVLVFSFYHAPVCSAFARSYRRDISSIHECVTKTDQIHLRSSVVLLGITLFFVFSCVMAMTPAQLAQAKLDNLPTLSVLANQPGNAFFSFIAPVIAFVAILTSFFGFFLGTIEVLNGLLSRGLKTFNPGSSYSSRHIFRLSLLTVALSCWLAGVSNWSVLAIMEAVVAPMMAVILFFVPVIALYRIDALKRYRSFRADMFVLVMGVVVVTGFLLSHWL